MMGLIKRVSYRTNDYVARYRDATSRVQTDRGKTSANQFVHPKSNRADDSDYEVLSKLHIPAIQIESVSRRLTSRLLGWLALNYVALRFCKLGDA